jgi:hypothetical protein
MLPSALDVDEKPRLHEFSQAYLRTAEHHGYLSQPAQVVLLTIFSMAAFCANYAHAQVRAFKLKRGHVSQLIIDQGAQLARLARVDANGREVGPPFDVLVQHRSGPEDQAIDDRWTRVDSIITCFPSSIEDPRVRKKTMFSPSTGAIKIRQYADGIVIVEPAAKDRKDRKTDSVNVDVPPACIAPSEPVRE